MTPEQITELEKRIETKFYRPKQANPKVLTVFGRTPSYITAQKQAEYSKLLLMRARDPLWKQAFDEYNKANPDNQYHMGCSPCFAKVLFWHKEKLINQNK